jgi:hypothetical protein
VYLLVAENTFRIKVEKLTPVKQTMMEVLAAGNVALLSSVPSTHGEMVTRNEAMNAKLILNNKCSSLFFAELENFFGSACWNLHGLDRNQEDCSFVVLNLLTKIFFFVKMKFKTKLGGLDSLKL